MLSLLIINSVHGRELTIHRCVLANGTLAFQERPCAKKKNKKSQKTSSTINAKLNTESKTKSKTAVKEIKDMVSEKKQLSSHTIYKNIDKLNEDDFSVKRISDDVRGYTVTMSVLKQWHLFKKVYNNKLLHMKILASQPGQELSLLIDFIFPDHKKFSDNELHEIVYLLGSQFIDGSKNKQLTINKINVTNGKGMMTTVAIKQRNSQYRYITKGTIYKNDWLIQFTLKSNDLNSIDHQFALQSLAHSINISR